MMGLDWRGSDSQGLYGQGTRGNGQTDFLFFATGCFLWEGQKKEDGASRRWREGRA